MKKHRFGALLLSCILVISSCMPVGTLSAFATESEETQAVAEVQESAVIPDDATESATVAEAAAEEEAEAAAEDEAGVEAEVTAEVAEAEEEADAVTEVATTAEAAETETVMAEEESDAAEEDAVETEEEPAAEAEAEAVDDEAVSEEVAQETEATSEADAETPAEETIEEAEAAIESSGEPALQADQPLTADEQKNEDLPTVEGTAGGWTNTVEDNSDKTSDDLFASYVEKQFEGASTGKPMLKARRSGVGSRLTGTERSFYNLIAGEVPKIAEGQSDSTVFSLEPEGFAKMSWTASELGVDDILVLNPNYTPAWEEDEDLKKQKWVMSEKAVDLFLDKMSFDDRSVVLALIEDFPYELYWFNKTVGYTVSNFFFNAYTDQTIGQDVITLTRPVSISLPVLREYAVEGETYRVNTETGTAVRAAVDRAGSILSKYSANSDVEKLKGYSAEICDLVSYNDTATQDSANYGYTAGSGNKVVYGNPWQLVWVFDGDPTTNVVCEGYAKAYQYLCDKTDFSDDKIGCICAGGFMDTDSNGHMWNIVTMENGRNYLVDVTNCDSGSVGYPDQLLLAGTKTYESGWYRFTTKDGSVTSYKYTQDMLNMFKDSELKLARGSYGSPDDKMEQPFRAGVAELTIEVGDWISYTADAPVSTAGHKELQLSGLYGDLYVKSANESVAKISTQAGKEGWIYGAAAGTTTVILTADATSEYDEAVVEVKINVVKKNQSLSLKSGSTAVSKGQTLYLTPGKTLSLSLVGGQGTLGASSSSYVTTSRSGSTFTIKGVKCGKIKLTLSASGTAVYNAASTDVVIWVVPAATTKFTATRQLKGYKLSWAKVTGANGYVIYRDGKKIKTITSGSTVAYSDTAATTNGKKYTYKIYAKAAAGVSPYYKSTIAFKLTRPAISYIKSNAAGKFSVKWGKNTKASGFEIQYSLKSNMSAATRVTKMKGTSCGKTISGLKKGRTYYVRVRSFKLIGKTRYYSLWSPKKTVKVAK